MKPLKIYGALYGVSAIATFAWLFLRLSGAAFCTAGWESCEAATGSAALLALAWPIYWGGWALGTPLAVQSVSIEGGLALLSGFAAMIVFTLAWRRFQ